MPVWVRLRLRARGGSREVEVSGKLNTGFSVGGQPLVRLPRKVAVDLGLDVERPAGTIDALDAGGRRLQVLVLGAVEVKAVAPDRETGWVEALAVYTGGDSVLLSDALMEELGLVAERPRSGLWRFVDEPPTKLRESATEERWPEA